MATKECRRCKTEFICLVENIKACGCSAPKLSSQTLQFLNKTKWNCLCISCLTHFEQLVNSEIPHPPLVEDTHYYMENGLIVFTELFHIQKGKCCGSGCRHCPYGRIYN
ncbi:MAG: cysteine-rich CWC family protein [Chitinophagales bacterium]